MIGYQEAVLRKFNSILTKMAIIDNRITYIESQKLMRQFSNDDFDELEDKISLPIKSMAQLDDIEEKLKNRVFLEKIVSCILQIFITILNSVPLNSNYK